jgi:carboxypeptidase Q
MGQRTIETYSTCSKASFYKFKFNWIRWNYTSVFINLLRNIKAEAIVVTDWNDLENKKDLIAGKIVVYNQKWVNYGQSVDYRSNGADRAAKYGAVGALVRSVTSESISSVHTGVQHSTAIPIAAITV